MSVSAKEPDVSDASSRAYSAIEAVAGGRTDTMSASTRRGLYEAGCSLFERFGTSEAVARGMSAQMMLESAYCTSLAGRYNYSGIKSVDGTGSRVMTFEYGLSAWDVAAYVRRGDYVSRSRTKLGVRHVVYDRFVDFASLEDYAAHKVRLLSSGRYAAHDVMSAGSPHEYFVRVKAAGYATAPDYVSALDATLAALDARAAGSSALEVFEHRDTEGWRSGRRLVISLPVYGKRVFNSRQ